MKNNKSVFFQSYKQGTENDLAPSAKKQMKGNDRNAANPTDGTHKFDKKSYRLKKYSKKYKLDHWEKQRRQKLMRDYYKEINCDPLSGKFTRRELDVGISGKLPVEDKKISVEGSSEGGNDPESYFPGQFVLLPEKLSERRQLKKSEPDRATVLNQRKSKKYQKHDAYILAKQEYKRIQDERKIKQEASEKEESSRTTALEEYRKKKAEKYKKLSQKTKKGQPVMKGRLELLLEKIQKSI